MDREGSAPGSDRDVGALAYVPDDGGVLGEWLGHESAGATPARPGRGTRTARDRQDRGPFSLGQPRWEKLEGALDGVGLSRAARWTRMMSRQSCSL